MTLSNHIPAKGQSVLLSIVIDVGELWSVPVKAVLARDRKAFRIQSGRVWRGAVVQLSGCKILKGEA